jgi:hypothetical protein
VKFTLLSIEIDKYWPVYSLKVCHINIYSCRQASSLLEIRYLGPRAWVVDILFFRLIKSLFEKKPF